MNFERNLKNILYRLFSKNNFNYIFGLLLITMFITILYKNNNLIEGNIVGDTNQATKKSTIRGARKTSDTQDSIKSTNKNSSDAVTTSTISNGNTIPDTEDNMNCSSNNFYNSDSQNTASKLVGNACLQGKRLKQENKVSSN